MRTLTNIFTTVIIFLILAGCNNSQSDKTNNKDSITDPKVANGANTSSNFELLQGKWQSNDDKTNFLVFEKNHRKEISEGMKSWDDEEFILSDNCMNETNQADKNPKEIDKYISCKKSDLCWYIVSISSESLTLQYMGRGNTLSYKRVNK
jgi:hypothetical protein